MGPLFSGVLMLILGGSLSIVIFVVAVILNYRSLLPRSTMGLARFAILTSASFWIGGGACGIVVALLADKSGTLETQTEVLIFLGASFLGGLTIAVLVSRMCWKSTAGSRAHKSG
ncbi:hypothetical protein [Sphingomonas sp.]|uniref:hypothetical protein n=1 Tax=Sphingomonas sp. TaxID=28214 RepID=UPI002FCB77DF